MQTTQRHPPSTEQPLPLPCPFCEGNPIVRTGNMAGCSFFRCLWCRKVWGVPIVARPH